MSRTPTMPDYCDVCFKQFGHDETCINRFNERIAELTAQRDETRCLVKEIAFGANEPWIESELLNLDSDFCESIEKCKEAVRRWELER